MKMADFVDGKQKNGEPSTKMDDFVDGKNKLQNELQ